MTDLTPRELKIKRLEDRIELGGRSARVAARQLEDLIDSEREELKDDDDDW